MDIKSVFKGIKTGIYRDFVLSLVASAITTIVAQLITYPFLARMCSSEKYGSILTIMGVGNVIVLAFGNSLNNVRLVMNNDYESENQEGDFLPILLFLSFVGSLVYCLYLLIFGESSWIIIISLCGFALFGILQAYGAVAFRLKINYVRNLILSIVTVAGNIAGLLIYYCTRNALFWALTFVIGQLAGLVYVHSISTIFREPIKFTRLLKRTLKKESVLLFTTLCANLLVYLDRLLLYPLLGGEAVSTYTVASFFGKSLAILMNPISGVLLSYYAQKNYVMNRNRFWRNNLITLFIAISFILFSLFTSEPVTGLLYPSIIAQAKPFLLIANIAAVLNVVGNMAQPAVLKFAPTKWLAINQITYMTVYLGLGYTLSKLDGLMGFSYAAFIAAMARVMIFYFVGHISLKERVYDA